MKKIAERNVYTSRSIQKKQCIAEIADMKTKTEPDSVENVVPVLWKNDQP